MLSRLRRRRLAVLAALVIAVAVGAVLILTSHSERTSKSTIQVLVDSRLSSLASLGEPTTAATITARAPLYADYIASPPETAKIAALAGVDVNALSVTANTTETAASGGPTVSTSYNAAPNTQAPANVVSINATDLLPVITITATSKSPGLASELVNATVDTMVSSVAELVSSEHVVRSDRMTIRRLGTPVDQVVRVKPISKKDLGAAVALFLVLLLAIFVLDVLLDRRSKVATAAAEPVPEGADSELSDLSSEVDHEVLEPTAERVIDPEPAEDDEADSEEGDPKEASEETDPAEASEETDPAEAPEEGDPGAASEETDSAEASGETDPAEASEETDPGSEQREPDNASQL